MRTTPFRVIAVVAMLSTCGGVIVSGQKGSILENVTDYRDWTRVTREPLPVWIDVSSVDPSAFGG